MHAAKRGVWAGVALSAGAMWMGCGEPADAPGDTTVDPTAVRSLAAPLRHGRGRTDRRPRCGEKPVALVPVGTYASGLFDEAAAEIVAHDPATQQLFVVNAAQARVDVLDVFDPSAPRLVNTLDLTAYGASVNSVDVRDGVVVAAVEAEDKTQPGAAVFVDALSLEVVAAVQVGALPDMVAFSPDGRFVLVANEGEPNDDYSVDPEGSVSVIDVRRGAARLRQRDVRTADFRRFEREALPEGVRIFGPGASVAQDLEPEYLAFSRDGRTAWVTLQENNALAVVDVRRARVEEILPLGVKDHTAPGMGLDASDRDDGVAIRPWPVRGLYLPDAIASLQHRGETYLLLANEGDLREYDTFEEEVRVKDLTLDPEVFPDASDLQEDEALGRLKVTRTLGDGDGDGDYEALYSIGGRSFSIRAADGTLVFDSGDEFERITAEALPAYFNASNDDSDLDSRSDDKGPEPEGITTGKVAGRTYAFIGLERVGGVMVYDVTDPHDACFVHYQNRRDFTADPETAEAGDLAPEGLAFIRAEDSPSGAPLLVVGNEVSGTTTLFEVRRDR